MSWLPKVSCQCLTYGRPTLLNEAVECFLRQDYKGPKELIIFNDQPGVEYRFGHPEVRIFNLSERVATIGGKRNLCAEMSSGEIMMPWDDDDIHLPWRISLTIGRMKNRHYFKAKNFWCWNSELKAESPGGKAPSMGAWSFEFFNKAGRYTRMQSGQDSDLLRRMIKNHRALVDIQELPLDELYYIYRWGESGHWHLSGWGQGQTGYLNAEQRVRKMPKGVYEIKPGWVKDYVNIVKEFYKC